MATVKIPTDEERVGICADVAHGKLHQTSLLLTDLIERLEKLGRGEEVMQAVLAKNCVLQGIKNMQGLMGIER